MNQDYGTPIPPIEEYPAQPVKKKNTTLIIIIVVLVVLCCCCVVFGGGGGWWLYNYGDQFIEGVNALPQIVAVL
ncbi:MAG: hypothetical protein B6D39_00755 [Anaerolineae bacterium UTCFX2]|jgi:flagellar basal body-associated protein FliL|nr:hypothetical protein [Anaerolineae bacterium]MCZ7551390.1 hypothetical protein [Anaerolineales bacterium]OQY94994.1 MAG: hypothetical protein B6D39_00755 [Anaerolineae bacterium UTCFX2]